MGTWSTSITGNDTAQDLKMEYTCAFFYYKDVDEAVRRIEEYAALLGIDESDAEEYCNYVYSLADFMWRKGILTDDIRDRAIRMIDEGFGLEIWEEEGTKLLKKRKDVLDKFRRQLISPMGARKKIRPNVYMHKIFEDGDLVAIKLITSGKTYSQKAMRIKEISQEQFAGYDGKYILVQKVGTRVSWKSSIVPEVCDCWAIFKLFNGVYENIPYNIEIKDLNVAEFNDFGTKKPYFCCESNMYYFKKRNYEIIGNYSFHENDFNANTSEHDVLSKTKSVFFSVYNEYNDADSDLIAAMKIGR